jgi:hypothetical protein
MAKSGTQVSGGGRYVARKPPLAWSVTVLLTPMYSIPHDAAIAAGLIELKKQCVPNFTTMLIH